MSLCSTCSAPASKNCVKCAAPYCSVACQKQDWKAHKKICRAPGDVRDQIFGAGNNVAEVTRVRSDAYLYGARVELKDLSTVELNGSTGLIVDAIREEPRADSCPRRVFVRLDSGKTVSVVPKRLRHRCGRAACVASIESPMLCEKCLACEWCSPACMAEDAARHAVECAALNAKRIEAAPKGVLCRAEKAAAPKKASEALLTAFRRGQTKVAAELIVAEGLRAENAFFGPFFDVLTMPLEDRLDVVDMIARVNALLPRARRVEDFDDMELDFSLRMPPVTMAAWFRRLDLMEAFVEKLGCDPGAGDPVGMTPLMHVSLHAGPGFPMEGSLHTTNCDVGTDSDLELMRWLLDERGVPVDVEAKSKSTAFNYAVVAGAVARARLLRERGADTRHRGAGCPPATPLHAAVSSEAASLEMVRFLVEECGADVRETIACHGSSSTTHYNAMHTLSKNATASPSVKLEIVEYLVRRDPSLAARAAVNVPHSKEHARKDAATFATMGFRVSPETMMLPEAMANSVAVTNGVGSGVVGRALKAHREAFESSRACRDATCRICHSAEVTESLYSERHPDGEPLLRPCSCRGADEWVHASCITKAMVATGGAPGCLGFYNCAECGQKWQRVVAIDLARVAKHYMKSAVVPGSALGNSQYANSMNNLADVLTNWGTTIAEEDEAIALQREALQMDEVNCGGNDAPDLAKKLMNLSITLSSLGKDGDEASALMSRGVAMTKRLAASDPGNFELRQLAAVGMSYQTTYQTADLKSSVAHAKKTMKELTRTLGPKSPDAIQATISYAYALLNEGTKTNDVKMVAKGQRLKDEARATALRVLGPRHPVCTWANNI